MSSFRYSVDDYDYLSITGHAKYVFGKRNLRMLS